MSLDKLYYSYDNPGAAPSGLNRLYQQAKAFGVKPLSRKIVKEYLRKQEVYLRFRKRNFKFKKRRIRAALINQVIQADVAYMMSLARYNKQTRFLLIMVDSTTNYLVVKTLKDKTAVSVAAAIDEALTKDYISAGSLLVDGGTEFWSRPTFAVLSRHDISLTLAEVHAQLAERYVGLVKRAIYASLITRSTKKYIDILPDLVARFNNTPLKKLKGLTPVMAQNPKYQDRLIANYKATLKAQKARKFSFTIGDYVRRQRSRDVFDKSYKGTFKEDIYQVTDRLGTETPHLYRIKDSKTGIIYPKRQYSYELQKTVKNPHTPYKK